MHSWVAGAVLLGGLAAAGACTVPEVAEVVGPTEWVERTRTATHTESFLRVSRREGVGQPAWVIRPGAPEAAVLLFAGGAGATVNASSGSTSANFLVRSRGEFTAQRLLVVVVGNPSDQPRLSGAFRHSAAHALDVKGLIAAVRAVAPVPVWVVGTSNGSASAANAAARLAPPDGPDGVVFTASVERSISGNDVFDADLLGIRVPALVVHHVDDACWASPYSGALRLRDSLWNAPAKELIAVEGGGRPFGEPCQPHHHHGFIGQERDVVGRIADWIKAHPPR